MIAEKYVQIHFSYFYVNLKEVLFVSSQLIMLIYSDETVKRSSGRYVTIKYFKSIHTTFCHC